MHDMAEEEGGLMPRALALSPTLACACERRALREALPMRALEWQTLTIASPRLKSFPAAGVWGAQRAARHGRLPYCWPGFGARVRGQGLGPCVT